jgi:mRNA-degrading endonuclease toxin of MazEF toxin-antitoxin module
MDPVDVRQGEIYWVTVREDETKGSEQHGRRPFIIVSRDAVNRALRTVVAVPMSSSNVQQQAPYRIVIPPTEITKDISCTSQMVISVAKTDQVRVIGKERLEQRIGRLSQTATISVTLGLAFLFDIR